MATTEKTTAATRLKSSMPALAQPTAELWNNIFNVALIVGAVVILVGTWGANWTGNMKEFYVSARIAANEATTAQANAEAARANEAAAMANQRASEADLARAKLEARLAPRKLTDDQKALLRQALNRDRSYSQIDVISEGNPEATYYASQFVQFFQSLGLRSNLRIDTFTSGPTPPGPFYIRKDPAGSIRRALTIAGFEHVGDTDYAGDEEPSFIVAPRPIDE